jgi:hypothetical protein
LITRKRHIAITLATASITACSGDICRTPRRMKGKLTDIVPSVLGSATFIPELRRMASRYTTKCTQSPGG